MWACHHCGDIQARLSAPGFYILRRFRGSPGNSCHFQLATDHHRRPERTSREFYGSFRSPASILAEAICSATSGSPPPVFHIGWLQSGFDWYLPPWWRWQNHQGLSFKKLWPRPSTYLPGQGMSRHHAALPHETVRCFNPKRLSTNISKDSHVHTTS